MANELERPRAPAGAAGRSDEALSRAALALNSRRPDEAERLARAVLDADPRHGRALYVFGCALLMQGRAPEAISPLETAARGRHDPEIETQLAIALRQSGRTEDALTRLKRATKWRPPHAAAFHELGRVLVAMERYDEAIEVLRRGLEVAPMMPQLPIQLGYAFLNRRDYASAKAVFARALGLAPDSPDALFGMASAHRQLGETQSAVEYFRRCLMRTPADRSTWLHLGHCLLELGQHDAGYECFRTAARGDPRCYGNALASLAAAGRGRFWLKPSLAAKFLRSTKS